MKEEIRKNDEKYEKEIKQMKEESEKKEKLNLEEKRRHEQKELENKKIEDSNNILLRQGSEKEFEYNNKYLLMKKEKDSEFSAGDDRGDSAFMAGRWNRGGCRR